MNGAVGRDDRLPNALACGLADVDGLVVKDVIESTGFEFGSWTVVVCDQDRG